MIARASMLMVVVAVGFAALAEQTFYALFEVPLRGTSAAELRFVTPLEAVRPWHMLLVFASGSVALASLGLALARRAPRAGTSFWIVGAVVSVALMAMAVQRPRLWTIALLDQGTPSAAPWGWSGVGALIVAAGALAAAVLLLTPHRAWMPAGGEDRRSLRTGPLTATLLVVAIPAAGLISGQALPWWTFAVATAAGGAAALSFALTTAAAIGLSSLAISTLGVAMALGAARRHEFLLAATLTAAALLLIGLAYRTARATPRAASVVA